MSDGLFATGQFMSEWVMEGYRIHQVACILDNLSQSYKLLSSLSSHHGVLKFLLLASNCCLPDVSSTAMDALVSLAPALSFPPSPLPDAISSLELLFHSMLNCVFSNDRMIIIKGKSLLLL